MPYDNTYRRSEAGKYPEDNNNNKKKKKKKKAKKNPYSMNPLSGERDKAIAWKLKHEGA